MIGADSSIQQLASQQGWPMDTNNAARKIAQMLSGYWISQMLYVAAKLDVAELLKDGPRRSEDLARQTETDPRSLYRLLRTLASVGVFAETEQGVFTMTDLAQTLRKDVPGSQRAMAIMTGE